MQTTYLWCRDGQFQSPARKSFLIIEDIVQCCICLRLVHSTLQYQYLSKHAVQYNEVNEWGKGFKERPRKFRKVNFFASHQANTRNHCIFTLKWTYNLAVLATSKSRNHYAQDLWLLFEAFDLYPCPIFDATKNNLLKISIIDVITPRPYRFE